MGVEVLLEVTDGVALVTLNAPARRNALTPAMADELIDTLDEINASDGVGAIVLRAAGASFCSGGDVKTLLVAGQDPAAETAYDEITRIYEAFARFGKMAAPTIAAVQGAAIGAGMNLLLAADLRIIAADATLRSGFMSRGLHPGGGHFSILSRLIGREAACAVALFGEELTGQQAADLGMAWEAPSADLVESRAIELATRIAADPLLARTAIASFRTELESPQMNWETARQFERAPQMWSMRRNAN